LEKNVFYQKERERREKGGGFYREGLATFENNEKADRRKMYIIRGITKKRKEGMGKRKLNGRGGGGQGLKSLPRNKIGETYFGVSSKK